MNFAPRLAAASLAVALACGCSWLGGSRHSVFIPEMNTAAEQCNFAQQLQANTFPSKDPKKQQQRLARLLAAYDKVIERFPDDPLWTPLAKLQIVELYMAAEMPQKALPVVDQLVAQVEELIASGQTDLEYIDAKARYDRGRCLEEAGRKAEAQEAYRDCMDRHKESTDSKIKIVVGWAKNRYERAVDLK